MLGSVVFLNHTVYSFISHLLIKSLFLGLSSQAECLQNCSLDQDHDDLTTYQYIPQSVPGITPVNGRRSQLHQSHQQNPSQPVARVNHVGQKPQTPRLAGVDAVSQGKLQVLGTNGQILPPLANGTILPPGTLIKKVVKAGSNNLVKCLSPAPGGSSPSSASGGNSPSSVPGSPSPSASSGPSSASGASSALSAPCVSSSPAPDIPPSSPATGAKKGRGRGRPKKQQNSNCDTSVGSGASPSPLASGGASHSPVVSGGASPGVHGLNTPGQSQSEQSHTSGKKQKNKAVSDPVNSQAAHLVEEKDKNLVEEVKMKTKRTKCGTCEQCRAKPCKTCSNCVKKKPWFCPATRCATPIITKEQKTPKTTKEPKPLKEMRTPKEAKSPAAGKLNPRKRCGECEACISEPCLQSDCLQCQTDPNSCPTLVCTNPVKRKVEPKKGLSKQMETMMKSNIAKNKNSNPKRIARCMECPGCEKPACGNCNSCKIYNEFRDQIRDPITCEQLVCQNPISLYGTRMEIDDGSDKGVLDVAVNEKCDGCEGCNRDPCGECPR